MTEAKAASSAAAWLEYAGIALLLFAALLALFAGYLFGWSNLQAGSQQRRLLASYSSTGAFPAFHGHTPGDGALAAVLDIPAIGVHQAVVEGTTARDLEAGPGLMPYTAVPGSRGDAVIAGRHGTYGSPFGHLSLLTPGSVISVVDYLGSSRYVVTSVRTLGPGQSFKVSPNPAPVLTLVTSRSSVPPSGLVVVTARLLGRPHVGAASSKPANPAELTLGVDTSGLWQLVGWALLLLGVLAATVVAYRRAHRPVLVYLLSTPVVLVAALFTFENLARLLPATM